MIIRRNENLELRRRTVIVMLRMFAAETDFRNRIDIPKVNLSPRRLTVGNPTVLIVVESIVEMFNLMDAMPRQNRRRIGYNFGQQCKILMLFFVLCWDLLRFGSDTAPTAEFRIIMSCLMTNSLVTDNQLLVENPHGHVIQHIRQCLGTPDDNRVYRGISVSFRYQTRSVNTVSRRRR